MSTLVKILMLLIDVFASLYLCVILLRFLLQAARADFYNPISQAIVKLTNPIVVPLRRVIPGLWGLDFATLLFALLFHALVMQIVILLHAQQFVNPLSLLIWSLIGLALNMITLYLIAGFVLFISSFIAPYSNHPALVLVRQLLAPLLSPIQRFIPPLGGLDFSLFFAGIFLMILRIVIIDLATGIGTPVPLLVGYA